MRSLTRSRLGAWPLAAKIFFLVCGGPYSTEQVVGKSGAGCGLLILALLPFLFSLPVGLMTAELSSKIPDEGGYFVWVKTAFGPIAGFLCAWWSWASSWVDLALFPYVAVQYAIRVTGHPDHAKMWVVGIIVVLTLWNILGIRSVAWLSYLLMVVVLAPFILLIGLGAKHWVNHPPHLTWLNPQADLNGIGVAMVFALWNYFGFDSVTTTAGEMSNASKVLPRAIFLSVILVAASIVAPVAAGLALKTDWPNWAGDSGYWPEIARAAWAPLLTVVVLGGAISNVGQFNANLLASSRIPFVLSNAGAAPKLFGAIHPRFGTPWVGIAFGGLLSTLLANESFEKLIAIDLSLYLVALMFECAALIVLRKKLSRSEDAFEIGGGKAGVWICAALPVLIGLSAIAMQLSPSTHLAETPLHPILIFGLLLASGPFAWAIFRVIRRKSR